MPSSQPTNKATTIGLYDPSDTQPDLNQAYVEVWSGYTGSHYYPAKPESTLAFIPDEDDPKYPNHYRSLLSYAELPYLERPVSQWTTKHRAANMHSSQSQVTWHPSGQEGPKEHIRNLPFYVDTDLFHESVTHEPDSTVPLPPRPPSPDSSTQQSSSAAQPTPSAATPEEPGSAEISGTGLSSLDQVKFNETMHLEKTDRTRSGLKVPNWRQHHQ